MNSDRALEIVATSLARVLEISPDSVTATIDLVEDLGVDSIGFIQLADAIELTLAASGVQAKVSDDALAQFVTVADVVEHVAGLG